MENPQKSYLQTLFSKKMLICVITGFSSGLPFLLLVSLVPAWLRSESVDLKTIGFFALIQFPYTWKFLWSPFLDRFAPFLGRRRGWILICQVLLFFIIGFLGGANPQENILLIATLCGAIAFISATLDIAIDAFRREILTDAELGLGNAIHVNAYRVAGLVPGSLSLILADVLPWHLVFWVTACFMIPGVLMPFFVAEPPHQNAPRTLKAAVKMPFKEFLSRKGWRGALLILGFIFLYKLGDSLATSLITPFYLDMGFSKTDIGLIAKHAALWPSVFGAMLGGLWMVKLGINRALWIFGAVQWVTILGFVFLASIAPFDSIGFYERTILAIVIALEYLGVGLGTAAFVAFIARETNPAYTATQMALFTSFAAVPRTFINAFAGVLVENLGWFSFFILCTILATPGMLLLFKIAPWNPKTPQNPR